MLIALLNGLLFILAIPPWWHYDEPGHFEYVWLAANLSHWPKQGEHDEAMRLQMAKSMSQYGWYARRNYKPDLTGSKPVWIGATQTGGKPAYYFVASLPLRVLRGADITQQYNAVRLTSLLLYLLTIWVIWKALGELLAPGHPLQWIVTGFIALLPAFADTMVSVSDDVGAALSSCLFLWLSIRLIKRGFSVPRLTVWLLSIIACYLAKNTAWYALLLAPLVLLFSILRGRAVRWIWFATPVLILAVVLAVFQGGGAASWYQDVTQKPPLRLQSPRATLGQHVLQLDYMGNRFAYQTGQFLSPDVIRSLRGRNITLGTWIWASRPVQVQAPGVRFMTSDQGSIDKGRSTLQLQTDPIFHRSVILVPPDALYAIVLSPSVPPKDQQTRLFLDGMVLTPGAYHTGLPEFGDSSGSRGVWNGRSFRNLIDNGSAEQGALRVRPAIDRATRKYLARVGNLSAIFSILGDWRGTSWYYADSLQTMSRTFWASAAADKFNLPGIAPNNILLGLTLIGFLGAVLLLWRKRKELRWDLIYVLLAAFLMVWGFTAVRGVSSLSRPDPTVPWARYAFPAILPTALVICVGWAEWLGLLGRRFRLPQSMLRLVPIGMMSLLTLYTLFNIAKFFHPSLVNREWLFWLSAGVLLLAVTAVVWGMDRSRSSLGAMGTTDIKS
ncbi:MAG TPA: hypothetical protein VMJ64_15705 [Anaerolineales bacterium]|nr:hypothetical protein [Anaerolineales bacterium]